jgi:hypothetical protein
MADSIKVTTDTAALARKLDQKVKRYPGFAAAGINKAAAGALTLAVREIQADIGASSQKTIRKNVTLTKATGAKPQARLTAFSSKRDRIPIFEMKPKPKTVTKRRPEGGVRYGVASKLLPGSFIARVASGHIGVFKRTGKFGRRGNPKLETIQELFGPSVALVFSRKKITGKITAFLREKVPQEVERAFRFVTGG